MIYSTKQLIKEQIRKSYEEILFTRFIFSFVNLLSLGFILYTFWVLFNHDPDNSELYMKFAEMGASLFAPYLAQLSQGYVYPRLRRINTLRYVLFKRKLSKEELSYIYEH